MAALSDRHHHLVTRREPMAGVAFSGKFWSMQHDCTERPFGLPWATFRFNPKMAKAKRKKTRS
jgi:hypothetical protein